MDRCGCIPHTQSFIPIHWRALWSAVMLNHLAELPYSHSVSSHKICVCVPGLLASQHTSVLMYQKLASQPGSESQVLSSRVYTLVWHTCMISMNWSHHRQNPTMLLVAALTLVQSHVTYQEQPSCARKCHCHSSKPDVWQGSLAAVPDCL